MPRLTPRLPTTANNRTVPDGTAPVLDANAYGNAANTRSREQTKTKDNWLRRLTLTLGKPKLYAAFFHDCLADRGVFHSLRVINHTRLGMAIGVEARTSNRPMRRRCRDARFRSAQIVRNQGRTPLSLLGESAPVNSVRETKTAPPRGAPLKVIFLLGRRAGMGRSSYPAGRSGHAPITPRG